MKAPNRRSLKGRSKILPKKVSIPVSNNLGTDPTRFKMIKSHQQSIKEQCLRSAIGPLLSWITINPPTLTSNVFCPTGPGGGVDPSCGRDDKGRGDAKPTSDVSHLRVSDLFPDVQTVTPHSDTKTTKRVDDWKKHPSIAALKDRLTVQGDHNSYEVQRHLRDFANVPEHLVHMVMDRGLGGVAIGDTGCPNLDHADRLKGTQPRGWPPGYSFDKIAGVYLGKERMVIAGKGDTGSVSLVLHEFGHSVGHLLKYDTSKELHEHHERIYDKLNPYLKQGGKGSSAGKEELFAEGFASVLKSRVGAVLKFDEKFVSWIEKEVLAKGAKPPEQYKSVTSGLYTPYQGSKGAESFTKKPPSKTGDKKHGSYDPFKDW